MPKIQARSPILTPRSLAIGAVIKKVALTPAASMNILHTPNPHVSFCASNKHNNKNVTYERQKHNNKRFFLPGPKDARTLDLFGVSILPNVDSAGRLLSSVEDFLGSESLLVL